MYIHVLKNHVDWKTLHIVYLYVHVHTDKQSTSVHCMYILYVGKTVFCICMNKPLNHNSLSCKLLQTHTHVLDACTCA